MMRMATHVPRPIKKWGGITPSPGRPAPTTAPPKPKDAGRSARPNGKHA